MAQKRLQREVDVVGEDEVLARMGFRREAPYGISTSTAFESGGSPPASVRTLIAYRYIPFPIFASSSNERAELSNALSVTSPFPAVSRYRTNQKCSFFNDEYDHVRSIVFFSRL